MHLPPPGPARDIFEEALAEARAIASELRLSAPKAALLEAATAGLIARLFHPRSPAVLGRFPDEEEEEAEAESTEPPAGEAAASLASVPSLPLAAGSTAASASLGSAARSASRVEPAASSLASARSREAGASASVASAALASPSAGSLPQGSATAAPSVVVVAPDAFAHLPPNPTRSEAGKALAAVLQTAAVSSWAEDARVHAVKASGAVASGGGEEGEAGEEERPAAPASTADPVADAKLSITEIEAIIKCVRDALFPFLPTFEGWRAPGSPRVPSCLSLSHSLSSLLPHLPLADG